MKKRCLCILIVVLLFVVSVPVKVEAASNYHYLDEKGTKQYIASSSVTVISKSSSTLKPGWYIVKDKITINDRSVLIKGCVWQV